MYEKKEIKLNLLFLEFVEYLIQLGYGEEPSGFIEGVIQRAFFDDWIKFLVWRKEIKGPFKYIADELLEDD